MLLKSSRSYIEKKFNKTEKLKFNYKFVYNLFLSIFLNPLNKFEIGIKFPVFLIQLNSMKGKKLGS
jgi:hypothetical protein